MRHQPLQGVALFLRLLLGLFMVASLVGILTAMPYRSSLLDVAGGLSVSSDEIVALEDRYNAAFLLGALTYIATAITFLVWFWRAYSNLTYLGRPRRRGPGWAIGSWFIPVAGLFIPYSIGGEIWTQSKPETGMVPERGDANMEPVISWWALFLIMSLVNVVESFMLPEDYSAGDLAAYVGVDMVSSVVAVAAALAAIRYVRLSTDRQESLLAMKRPSVPD